MAARFWVAQPVTGAIVSVASPPQIRLTVSSTTGMTTGDVRTVSGVGGTTEANGTWTITVIDGTHIDLQGTTFSNVYTSGGSVNGRWDATNTNNMVSTSGGTNYGQTVPGSADTMTFDASSGGGTVTVNTTISVFSLTLGAFTGTLDFSANNNNVTLSGGASALSYTGTGTRTFNMGSGTWTFTGAASSLINGTTQTNLTLSAASANLVFTATSASSRSLAFGAVNTFGSVTINANTSGGQFSLSTTGTGISMASLSVVAPNYVSFSAGATTTVTNAMTFTGTSSNQIGLISNNPGVVATISSANNGTFSWCSFHDLTFSGGGTFTGSQGFNLGNNTGITITAPSGGGSVVGG